jgi:inosose dehydratase
MIRYGTNPIAWSNDDDRSLGADAPLERCLDEAGRIGFEGIEKGWKFPDDPAAMGEALAPHGLALISGWWSTNLLERSVEDELAAMKSYRRLMTGMETGLAILCETTGAIHGDPVRPLPTKPVLARDDWPRLGQRLTELAKRLRDEGLTPVYHHHMGAVVQFRNEIDALMDAAGDELALLLDAGHAFFADVDPVKLARDYMPRVSHIHAKNVRPAIKRRAAEEGMSFLQAVRAGVFTVPGDPEGGVDFEPILRVAAEHGYRGWLVIEAEQDPEVRNPWEYQSMGLGALREAARAAGLDRSAA